MYCFICMNWSKKTPLILLARQSLSILLSFQSLLPYLLNRLLPIFCIEYSTSCDQPIGSSLCYQTCSLNPDTPIYLDIKIWILFVQICDLFYHFGHKLLTPEARLHSHNQQSIHIFLQDKLLNGSIDGSIGFD